jgi:hypothetical protein
MASERPGSSSCLAAHASTPAEISGGSLTALTGYTPPFFLGRPRDFLFTEIDFAIFSVYRKCKPRGSANFRLGSNPDHTGGPPMAKATRVHSTPPTNTSKIRPVDPTRRDSLAY